MTTPSFTCPLCRMESFHPSDVEQGYCGRCHAFTGAPVLTQFVIYERPLDYPGHYVVRQWGIFSGLSKPVAGVAELADSLENARKLVPQGMVRLGHQPGEDATIVETWT